jgi:hypothetical protein
MTPEEAEETMDAHHAEFEAWASRLGLPSDKSDPASLDSYLRYDSGLPDAVRDKVLLASLILAKEMVREVRDHDWTERS